MEKINGVYIKPVGQELPDISKVQNCLFSTLLSAKISCPNAIGK